MFFFAFVIIGRYGKWLTDINLLLVMIRQMAALVRRALAEVCTVLVLLVEVLVDVVTVTALATEFDNCRCA